MQNDLKRKLAANESVFRLVNEGIARGQWPGDSGELIGFRCECAQLGCNSLVMLTREEYEHVRASPRRFLMLPGHELPEVESVLERRPGYCVVEKDEQAGREAEELDPRT
jgi:hypothetical protein